MAFSGLSFSNVLTLVKLRFKLIGCGGELQFVRCQHLKGEKSEMLHKKVHLHCRYCGDNKILCDVLEFHSL